ncbi:MAG: PfkB family carbohydrate kinase [Armatimonadota bacterium]
MDSARLRQILDRFPRLTIGVLGDFFLDYYLIIDPALSEVSLETGLEAYQVIERRCSPGAAGTVCNNLSALGAGTMLAIGAIGEDGNGYELKKGLVERGVNIEHLVENPELFTPTYTKPMVREGDGTEREINRQDIKNRGPLWDSVQDRIIEGLRAAVKWVDGIIIADQVQERNCGVVTDRMRDEIARLAEEHPEKVFCADSRVRIGEFRGIMLKPNRHEAAAAVDPEHDGDVSLALAEKCGTELVGRTGKPVFVTVGQEGIIACTDRAAVRVPAVRVTGEIDIVGAGDATMAGIVLSLCAGATPEEAALVANLVASITIQQFATTGTASREQVLARLEDAQQ